MSRPYASFAGVGATKNTGHWPFFLSFKNEGGVFYGTNLNIKNRTFTSVSQLQGQELEN